MHWHQNVIPYQILYPTQNTIRMFTMNTAGGGYPGIILPLLM